MITLRGDKGSALTHAELDDNFTTLNEAIQHDLRLVTTGPLTVKVGDTKWFPPANVTLLKSYLTCQGTVTAVLKKNGQSLATFTGTEKSQVIDLGISLIPTDYLTVDITNANGSNSATLNLSYRIT